MKEKNFTVERIKWDNGKELWLVSKCRKYGFTITRNLALLETIAKAIANNPLEQKKLQIFTRAIELIKAGTEGDIIEQ